LVPGTLNLARPLDGSLAESPPERVFLGFRQEPEDHYVYLAMARWVSEHGGPATPDLFVTDPQDGRFLLLYVAAVGWVAGGLGLDPKLAWYGVGYLASFGFLLVAWAFLRRVIADDRVRRLAFFLVALSGGVEWVVDLLAGVGPFRYLAQDPALEQSYNWTSFASSGFGMWVTGYACALLAAMWADDFARERRIGRAVAAAALVALGGLVHPYAGLAGAGLLGVLALSPLAGGWITLRAPERGAARRYAPLCLVALGAALVLGLYHLWARADPVYGEVAGFLEGWQVRYGVGFWPIGYGLVLVLALPGLARVLDRETMSPAPRRLLVSLLATTTLLSLLPPLAGVKFQFMVHLPLSAVAAYGLGALLDGLRARLSHPAALAVTVALWLVLTLGSLASILRPFQKTPDDPLLFASQAEFDLLATLDAQPEGAVLTSRFGGRLVPWLARKPVYIGHWALSTRMEERMGQVAGFWSPRVPTAAKRAFLEQNQIAYVLQDPWVPGRAPVLDPGLGLRLLFENAHGRLFAVVR
jgi:hypothetical protein